MTETALHVDPDFVALADHVFAKWNGGRVNNRSGLDPELWKTLGDAGLTRLTGLGELGSGASWLESAELLRAAARHGVAAPTVENDLLAGWLADSAALEDSGELRSACVLDESGRAFGVPWASAADSIVVLWQAGSTWLVDDVAVAELQITRGTNLAGEPRDAVELRDLGGRGVEIRPTAARELRLRGALARAIQMGGALERALDLAVAYSSQRTQFGRPIAAFQAVQQLATHAAAETSLALAAADRAVMSAALSGEWTSPQLAFEVASAKVCAGVAASIGVRNVHQIFGAIGTTAEHELHTVTLPALAWASEFGTSDSWAAELLRLVAQNPAHDGLWQLITGVGDASSLR